MAHFLVEAPSSGQPLQASESCGLESISTYVMSSESAEMRDRRAASGERNAPRRKVFEWALFRGKESIGAARSGRPSSLGNLPLTEDKIRVLI